MLVVQGGGGALALWKRRGCKADKTPLLSIARSLSPNFLILFTKACSLTQRPIVLSKCGLTECPNSLTQWFFVFWPSKSPSILFFFSQFCPHWRPKFNFSPNDPIFFSYLLSPNASGFMSACHTPISILKCECLPPPSPRGGGRHSHSLEPQGRGLCFSYRFKIQI